MYRTIEEEIQLFQAVPGWCTVECLHLDLVWWGACKASLKEDSKTSRTLELCLLVPVPI